MLTEIKERTEVKNGGGELFLKTISCYIYPVRIEGLGRVRMFFQKAKTVQLHKLLKGY